MKRTSVRRRRHLYRTFSQYLSLRLQRSTWLFVRTFRASELRKNVIILRNFALLSSSRAAFSSGMAWYRVFACNARQRHQA